MFGVCCEPLSRQVFFLIDEAEQAGKGAVVMVSLVHAFFHLHGLEERRVTLQADNCVGQNKNTKIAANDCPLAACSENRYFR